MRYWHILSGLLLVISLAACGDRTKKAERDHGPETTTVDDAPAPAGNESTDTQLDGEASEGHPPREVPRGESTPPGGVPRTDVPAAGNSPAGNGPVGNGSTDDVLNVSLSWEKAPVANSSDNTAILSVETGETRVEILDVDPQMPQHGHGTVRDYQVVERIAEQPATFRLSGFFFVMPGSWKIDITMLVGQTHELRSFDVEVK